MPFDISSYKRVVILTGAGISAASGIRTFRDSNGLWENHRIEDVATPEAFARDPVLVWSFYSMRRQAAASAQPNKAHVALAEFADRWRRSGRNLTLVTQNVDMLHERACTVAGSHAGYPLAMHGTLSLSRCTDCGRLFDDLNVWFDSERNPIFNRIGPLSPPLPGSGNNSPDFVSLVTLEAKGIRRDRHGLPLSSCCGALLRPHIVWFGEIPFHMDQIDQALEQCDLFVSIGSSGAVYPAAGFIERAKFAGAHTACFNKEPLPQRGMVDFYVEGPATATVPTAFHCP